MPKSMEIYMKSSTVIIVASVIALLAVLAFSVLNTRENRTFGDKVGDAAESVSDGLKDAGRSMEDRTPAEKISDGVSDVKEDIKESVE